MCGKAAINWESIVEQKDDSEPDLFKSESSSDSDEEPELSNVVMHAKSNFIQDFFHLVWIILCICQQRS